MSRRSTRRKSATSANSTRRPKALIDHGASVKSVNPAGDEYLDGYSSRALKIYGDYVIEQRAVPDFRDGLKPVMRSILWSMYNLNLHHNGPFKKCARVVGDTMGLWHPHSDSSIYDTLVNLVNSPTRLIEGYGAFGDHCSPAGASRYCFVGSTRIMTEYGLIKIRDIPQISLGMSPKTYLKNSGLHVGIEDQVSSLKTQKVATAWVNSGKHSTVRVTTNYGMSIRCTPNQPLYVLAEGGFCWKKVQDLKVGDKVAIKQGCDGITVESGKPLPVFNFAKAGKANVVVYPNSYFPDVMSENLAFVLGCIVSEGSGGFRGVHFSNTVKSYYDAFVEAWEAIFDSRIKISKCLKKPNSYGKKIYKEFRVHYGITTSWFENLGVEFGSYNQVVPEVIFQSSKKEVASFLRGLYEGDGSVSSRIGASNITYSSVSVKLLKDIQLLLLNYFGICSTLIKSNTRNDFRLNITSLTNMVLFRDHIDFVSLRKRKVLYDAIAILDAKKNTTSKGGSPYGIPKEFSAWVHREYISKYVRAAIVTDEYGSRVLIGDQRIFHKIPNDVSNFAGHVAKYSAQAEDRWPTLVSLMKDVADRNYRYATITEIETAPDAWVYDLTVPGTNAFVANGFISHNTEAKLSRFSDMFLLDPEYLEVSDMIPNYSEDKKIPLVLPAKLPVALLLGSKSIAVGIAAATPSFSLESVTELAKQALRAELDRSEPAVDADDCYSTLKFAFSWGGTCKSTKAELIDFFKTGKGSLLFSPNVEKDYESNPKQYVLTSVCPGMTSKNVIDGWIKQVSEMKGVAQVFNGKDKRGVRYVVRLNKNVSFTDSKAIFAAIDNTVLRRQSFDMGMTDRTPTGVKFFRTTVPDLLLRWAKWRVKLERRVLKNMALKEKEKLLKLKLLGHAVSNIKIVAEALKQKDPETYLVTHLNISVEDANYIRDQKFRTLEAQDLATIQKRIADSLANYKQLASDYKAPLNRLLKEMDSMLSKVTSASSAKAAAKKGSSKDSDTTESRSRSTAKKTTVTQGIEDVGDVD